MAATSLVVIGGAIVAGNYVVERLALKKNDKDLARERAHALQTVGASLPGEITHLLHPQHQITLESTGVVSQYICAACQKPCSVSTMVYRCRVCEFVLHPVCALSTEMADSWKSQISFKTFAHKHPVKLVMGTSEFTCSHCKHKGHSFPRYQCAQKCHKQMHLICATNPAVIVSFLHPNHVLELKTRHHFKKCAVCHHGGESNARVYTCEACDFCVHPDCAHCYQYCVYHPLHPHTLVYQELPKGQQAKCHVCHYKCKSWTYTCYFCKGVEFHRECLQDYFFAREKQGFREGFKDGVIEGAKGALVKGLIAAVTGGTMS